MTRSLLLAALMALSLNASALPVIPVQLEPIKTHKCNVVQPTKAPCKAPCSVCYKGDEQVTCGGAK